MIPGENSCTSDIIDSARTVARWLAERDGQWDDDEILRNAVLRQLSVVGEAASCLATMCAGGGAQLGTAGVLAATCVLADALLVGLGPMPLI